MAEFKKIDYNFFKLQLNLLYNNNIAIIPAAEMAFDA